MKELFILYELLPPDSDILCNVLILLYKKLVYTCKDKPTHLTLDYYKIKVKELEIIEYRISQNNKKLLTIHTKKLKKYEQIIKVNG